MLLLVLAKGILMGLAIAAPVGPIALLCIRRTIAQGHLTGLVTGFGAATADGLYGMVAAFGLTIFSNFLINNAPLLQVFGGIFLCYLGLSAFFAEPTISPDSLGPSALSEAPFGLLSSYLSTLFLTLTNPATILSFVAIFAGLGLAQTDRLSSIALVVGVSLGSALWWLLLVSGITYFRNRLTSQRLQQFNQASTKVFGGLIFGFGALALLVSQKP